MAVALGVISLVVMVLFGVIGYLSERNITFRGRQYHLDMYGKPHLIENPATDKPVTPSP